MVRGGGGHKLIDLCGHVVEVEQMLVVMKEEVMMSSLINQEILFFTHHNPS